MQAKLLFISGLGILGLSIVFSIFFTISSSSLSPTTHTQLEDCDSLSYNGENKINLLFFGTKAQVETYKDFLFEITPYKENIENFNLYYIPNYTPTCSFYKGKALFCYSRELIQKAASCPNDFVVVLQSEKENIRSSSYLNVISVNTNLPETVLAHELGHALGNLADEYVPANIPSGSPNCARKCSFFDGFESGCFEGCSKQEYFRSIDSGIMRTLFSANYGEFNENVISAQLKKKTSKSITGFSVDDTKECNKEKYLLIEGTYQDGNIDLKNPVIESGCASSFFVGDFKSTVTYNNIEGASSFNFNPKFIFTDSQVDSDETIEGDVYVANNEDFFITLPYKENYNELLILDENNNIITNKKIGVRTDILCKQ